MRFEVVAHACLLVEAAGKTLLVDPWLYGPVYWGSWWHCPEPVISEKVLNPDCIYITHWHMDHFHPESLARIDKRAHVYIPEFPISPLEPQIRALGFQTIIEMKQARTYSLAPGLDITSYQVQVQDDSVVVIDAEGQTLMNVNDSKPMPSTWKTLKARHAKVDFLFRSHSCAWSYPNCFEFEDPQDMIPVSQNTYLDSFRECVEMVKPRFAIPFASNVCHLHRESKQDNGFLTPALEVARHMARHPVPGTDLRLMPPGSSWDSFAGFSLTQYASDFPAAVIEAERKHAGDLEVIYRSEDEIVLNEAAFEHHFRSFLKDIWWIRRFLKIVIDFAVLSPGVGQTRYWRLDFRRGEFSKIESLDGKCNIEITVRAGLLADACRQSAFTSIDISKRWRVRIHRGSMIKHLLAMNFISLWEGGYFSSKLFSLRFLVGTLRRWPEVMDYLKLVFKLATRGSRATLDTVTKKKLPAA